MVAFTSCVRDDGFGSQFQTILGAVLFAEFHGHEFTYSPPRLAHLYTPEEVEEIENIINFKDKFRLADGSEQVIDLEKSYNFLYENIDTILQSPIMQKIRNIFKENKPNPFNDNEFNVAIHIRRPSIKETIDVIHQNGGWGDTKHIKNFDQDQTNRFTRNGYFLDVMNLIRKSHPGAKFHIFSDGAPELYECFKANDVTLHLSTSLMKTYTYMVYANILVISKSSFSYTAALLRDQGSVYYTPFWCAPASNWVNI